MIAQVPFVLSDDASHVDLHLVRSNPIARMCKQSTSATLAVTGPDSYISPDWYQSPDQVPTWNYLSVHLVGRLEPLLVEELTAVLSKLSHVFESRLAPKPEWTHEKMTSGVFEKMKRMILPFRFHIDDVQSTWKLGQNKTTDARESAADAVAVHGIGSECESLAEFMHALPKEDL